MSYKPRRERRARGGKAADTQPLHLEHGHQYNAQGSPEEKEESEGSGGFKRGGRAKKKEGGHVEGHGAKHHLGKRARGGAMHHEKRAAGGKAEERGEVSGKEKEDSEYASDRKRGGHVEHEEEKREHRARGGHVRHKHARGGAPFSEAHNLTAPGNDKKTGPGESTDSIP